MAVTGLCRLMQAESADGYGFPRWVCMVSYKKEVLGVARWVIYDHR